MNFTVERDFFAAAVAWVARSLPSRPMAPALAGLLVELTAENDGTAHLAIAGSDHDRSARVTHEVQGQGAGRILVSGRLLADIAKALPKQEPLVRLEADDSHRAVLTCGSSRFVLPLLDHEQYPELPDMPEAVGTVESDVLEHAVAQVAVAAGREDTLAVLTCVRVEIDGDRMTLAATDRYRLAVRELTWKPRIPGLSTSALVPARKVVDASKSMLEASAEAIIHLTGGGVDGGRQTLFGLSAGGRTMTSQLGEGEFPKYRSLLPEGHEAVAELPRADLIDSVRRVALVAERNTPIRLVFTEGSLVLQAFGVDEATAEETLDVAFEGPDLTIAFNPQYLLDGLAVLDSDTVRMAFTAANKPALLTGKESEDAEFRYLLMPVRLPS